MMSPTKDKYLFWTISTYLVILVGLGLITNIPSINYYIYDNLSDSWRSITLGNPFHLFGTGPLGEDFGAYFIKGFLKTILAGMVGACISVLLGAVIGSGLGYIDGIGQRFFWYLSSSLGAFPVLFVILLYTAFCRNYSLLTIMIIFGVFHSPEVAEQIKHKILELKRTEYIDAARSLGLSESFILVRHILIKSCASLLAMSAVHALRDSIIVDISIAVLGMGIPHDPSMGCIIYETFRNTLMIKEQPIVHWFLCLVITGTTILALNTLGDLIGEKIQVRRK